MRFIEGGLRKLARPRRTVRPTQGGKLDINPKRAYMLIVESHTLARRVVCLLEEDYLNEWLRQPGFYMIGHMPTTS